MYIKNIDRFPKESTFKTNKTIALWLINKQRLPLLGKEGNIYYFAETAALEIALTKIPFWLNSIR